MTLERITAGINKTEYARKMDAQIGFADALRRIFPTALASYLQFRGWVCRETLCGRSSVTFGLRQCAAKTVDATGRTNCRLSRPAAVQYGPTGNAPGQRRLAGRFVYLSYQISSRSGHPVRFEARFRQDGPVTLEVW